MARTSEYLVGKRISAEWRVLAAFPESPLLFRFAFLALVFAFELVAIPALLGKQGLAQQISSSGTLILHAVLGFIACFATFAWLKWRPALSSISTELRLSPINSWLFAAHSCAIALFALLSSSLSDSVLASRPPLSQSFALLWLMTGILAVVLAAVAIVPCVFWIRLFRETGRLWIWSLAAASLIALIFALTPLLWPLATQLTFLASSAFLRLFVPHVVIDAGQMLIGTPRFQVIVSPACSGLEGIGLILAFGLAWLGLFHKECRFPHALLLLPAGALIMFGLNAIRIAVLVLIGNSGSEQIAVRGFHSQAGWIAFNIVALGLSLSARKISWISNAPDRSPGISSATARGHNPTLPWLLPFVLLLAAGMLSAALTGNFEWFYPLRFFAVAIPLAFLWPQYKQRSKAQYNALNWRISWLAPFVGILVFLIWIALDRHSGPDAMPAALTAASPLSRNLWLTFRVLAATITVPIAEELAFRGFLYRRLLSAVFESVPFQRFSWFAFLASSIAFGLLHGDRWFVGVLAGALYTLVLLRRGSLGDAVVAHSTTNALLAIDVLAWHHWHLW